MCYLFFFVGMVDEYLDFFVVLCIFDVCVFGCLCRDVGYGVICGGVCLLLFCIDGG